MKKENFKSGLMDIANMDIASRELSEALMTAFKQYEWRMRSERIKAGIREAKLRKENKAV